MSKTLSADDYYEQATRKYVKHAIAKRTKKQLQDDYTDMVVMCTNQARTIFQYMQKHKQVIKLLEESQA